MFVAECCKYEFDTTYPVHLNGIISQEEFVQSIEKINRTFASGRKLVFLPLFVFLGFIVIIAIVIVRVKSDINGDNFGRVPIIIGVCFGLVFLMILLLSVLQCRRMAQLRQTIAEESARYSSRSTPCSWRLETTTFYTGNFENRKTETTYHVKLIHFFKILIQIRCSCFRLLSILAEDKVPMLLHHIKH